GFSLKKHITFSLQNGKLGKCVISLNKNRQIQKNGLWQPPQAVFLHAVLERFARTCYNKRRFVSKR
ncbi:MAG: hypothetical protein ACI4DP_03655, partial [Candidatus Ornithomonoglobus sp.]